MPKKQITVNGFESMLRHKSAESSYDYKFLSHKQTRGSDFLNNVTRHMNPPRVPFR